MWRKVTGRPINEKEKGGARKEKGGRGTRGHENKKRLDNNITFFLIKAMKWASKVLLSKHVATYFTDKSRLLQKPQAV